MVINNTRYSEASYWASTDPLTDGYTDYILYNANSKVNDTKSLFGSRLDSLYNFIPTFAGKKILEIGGAFGHYTQYAISLGLNWKTVEISSYCNTNKVIPPENFINQDAITYLASQTTNSYDYIISIDSLPCFTDAELTTLITQMNRVCKTKQIHIVTTQVNENFYNKKTLEQWKALSFKTGTVIIDTGDFYNYNYSKLVTK